MAATKDAPRALITGITGQDGSYLAELLLAKGYNVHGLVRRASTTNLQRIGHLVERVTLHQGDLTDGSTLRAIVARAHPHEVYNLAAQSHVQVSFDVPEFTGNVDALGVTRLLEAIRACGLAKTCRFYQASTSELFGEVVECPQTETTPFNPRSPYAIAKHYAFSMVKLYREAYGMFACNGVLFNHESPRRGTEFVTRKVTSAVARVHAGKQEVLALGNLNAKRDWGDARDFVEGMWRMLQHPRPEDYVLATGETHTVRAFVEAAFTAVGVTLAWRGEGLAEEGYDVATGVVRVRVDPAYFRPENAEVELLLGDARKAKAKLGWTPRTRFAQLVADMVAADVDATKGSA